jgi:circadian clock protein KaiB
MTGLERVTPVIEETQLYLLKLFIAGEEPNSRLARENLKLVCDEYLNGRCRIEEVDVLSDFASALKNKVFVTPTLILVEPEPRATIVGNLGNQERVISALRLRFEHGK